MRSKTSVGLTPSSMASEAFDQFGRLRRDGRGGIDTRPIAHGCRRLGSNLRSEFDATQGFDTVAQRQPQQRALDYVEPASEAGSDR